MTTLNALKGFKEIQKTKYANIPLGSYVRYFKNGELRYGGFLKVMKYPDYMVLFNYKKKVSWSVQFKDPSLHVWVKKLKPKPTNQQSRKKTQ
tara:strand:- start:36731 stop:37006 length:276 start_codon:yes stop_codon:yes gene_type:complete